ncbi:MAG: phospholipase D family protein [Alicyclobacillus sp.]|nr:phospholipase D family protein [Alicyclobacillus sp.]
MPFRTLAARCPSLCITSLCVAGLLFLATGCLPARADPKPYRPEPVTEAGMTFDWGYSVKTQALQMIQSSQHLCELDIYELSDPDILRALAAARRRGVDVRVVVDATESASLQTAVPQLRRAGVPVAELRIPRGISHIKMLIADGPHGGVLIGGMNFGASSWANNDGSVYLSHPSSEYQTLFRWDWERAHHVPAAAPTLTPPLVTDRGIEAQVVAAIEQAQHTISLEAFDLTDYTVLDDLMAAARRGVTVEVLLDPGQSLNRKAASQLRDAGVTVRFYKPYDGEWMHAKMLSVDDGKVFLIGSANFSHQAYTYNHEADIVLHDVPAFAQSLEQDLSIQISRGTDYPVRSAH